MQDRLRPVQGLDLRLLVEKGIVNVADSFDKGIRTGFNAAAVLLNKLDLQVEDRPVLKMRPLQPPCLSSNRLLLMSFAVSRDLYR